MLILTRIEHKEGFLKNYKSCNSERWHFFDLLDRRQEIRCPTVVWNDCGLKPTESVGEEDTEQVEFSNMLVLCGKQHCPSEDPSTPGDAVRVKAK